MSGAARSRRSPIRASRRLPRTDDRSPLTTPCYPTVLRRTHFPASPDEIRDAPWFNQYWYYAIELTPGLFTQGEHHDNIVLTRTILRNCGVEDQRCLDIGTMEGLVPV